VSTRLTLAFVLLLLGAGCGREESPRAFVIPGPTGPSPVPTAAPFVWDTRDELAVWAANNVTSGAIVIEGDGTDAFIRVERTDQDWVLRGPDFSPMATGVVGVRVRCRFMPDPSLPATAARSIFLSITFDTPTTATPYSNGQTSAWANLKPATEFSDDPFASRQFLPPIDVRYAYLHGTSSNRGMLDIDRIELVR
jgi:hypothetical protein